MRVKIAAYASINAIATYRAFPSEPSEIQPRM
jgi:hypothetical protein